MNEKIARLGDAVKRRRDELSYTQQDVAQAGGPSDTTQGGIEAGTAKAVSAATLRKLEAALGWQVGSARAVMDGEEPVVLDAPTEPRTGRDHIDKLVYLAEGIAELSTNINEAAKRHSDLQDIAERADDLARYATLASLSELASGDDRARVVASSFAHWSKVARTRTGLPKPLPVGRRDQGTDELDDIIADTLTQAARGGPPGTTPEDDGHVDGMTSRRVAHRTGSAQSPQ